MVIMDLCNFSSIIELAAGLNIAFVAVEYAKTYTKILSDYVFKFPAKISNSFIECEEQLKIKHSLAAIKTPLEVNGRSIMLDIESAKNEADSIGQEIEAAKTSLENEIANRCEAKSFSALSLWMFMYSVVLLFICGVCAWGSERWGLIAILLCCCSIVYLLLGWTRGENEKQWKLLDYTLVRYSVIWFFIALALSITLGYILNPSTEFLQCIIKSPATISIIVLLPFANFLIYFLLIRQKAMYLTGQIKKSVESITTKCQKFKEQADPLLSVNKISISKTQSHQDKER